MFTKQYSFAASVAAVLSVSFLALPLATYAATSASELRQLIDAQSTTEAGYAVSSAGDVNNDGYDDFLVAAPFADDVGADSGAAYLVYGNGDVLSDSLLASAVKFTGVATDDQAGTVVAGAGDVNNDGFDDFLIGAPGNDDASDSAGAVYLVYGGSSLTSKSLSDSSIVKFTGEAIGDSVGSALAIVGDVNKDGYDDALIGSANNDDAGSNAGTAYLVYGSSSRLTSVSLSDSSIVKFTGEAAGDKAGTAVARASDVNNDTYPDMLVGAPFNDDGATNAGAAYVIYGSSSLLTSKSLSDSSIKEFTGEAANDNAGAAAAGVGDANHDGKVDFVVGAPHNDTNGANAGAAYLVYGSSSLASKSLADVSIIKFAGNAAGDNAGAAVSPAGNVDGDLYADFMIGAPFNDDGGSNAGVIYVVHGSGALTSVSLNSSTEQEFSSPTAFDRLGSAFAAVGDVNADGNDDIFFGDPHDASDAGTATILYMGTGFATRFTAEESDTYAGTVATSAGDVNNDGYNDFVIGAPNNSDAATNAGAVYIIFGSATPLTADDLTTAVKFTGENANDQAGYSVASAGDVNNDGFADVVVGAPFDDVGGTDAGAIYIIYGGSSLTSKSLADSSIIKLHGTVAGDEVGYSVASAGDVNNDDFDEVLAGAPFDDDTSTDAGMFYLVKGGSSLTSGTMGHSSTSIAQYGDNNSDKFGTVVSAAGDVNNDGFADFLVSAPFYDGTAGADTGAVYLYFGASDITSLSVEVITGAAASDQVGSTMAAVGHVNDDLYDDFVVGSTVTNTAYLVYGGASIASNFGSAVAFAGAAVNDDAGSSVASAGDINEDGYNDFLIGAPGNDDAATDAGAAYVVYGKPALYSSTTLNGLAMIEFTGSAAGDAFGTYVYGAGDTNGDGLSEISVVANRGSQAGPTTIGYIYIDADHDGIAGLGGVFEGSDCNDADSGISADQTYYADVDGDGLGDVTVNTSICSMTPPTGYVANSSDVDDNDFDNDGVEGATWSGTDCDDNDVHAAVNITYYADSDGDTLGNPSVSQSLCENVTAPTGYVTNALDTVGDHDHDNDGVITASDCNDHNPLASALVTYYQDLDTDTLGNPSVSQSLCEDIAAPTGYVTNSLDTNDTLLDPTALSTVVGATNGSVTVTYTDLSTHTFPVFNVTSSSLTTVKLYGDTGYVLVLHPKGKKIALLNPYTGEVIQSIKLSKKAKYTSNSLKILDVRNNGTLDIVVTSQKKDKVLLTLLKFNSTTVSMTNKSSEKLTGASKVKVSKTKSPKKTIVLRNKNKHILYTFKVSKKFKMSVM